MDYYHIKQRTWHTLHILVEIYINRNTTIHVRQKSYISPKCHYISTEKGCRTEIIEGLHNHDLGNEINNIYPGWNNKSNNIGPCHACNGPHFVKDCDETMCLRCKPNFDHCTLSKCPRKCHPNKQFGHNDFNNKNNGNRWKINQHTKPNLQLSV